MVPDEGLSSLNVSGICHAIYILLLKFGECHLYFSKVWRMPFISWAGPGPIGSTTDLLTWLDLAHRLSRSGYCLGLEGTRLGLMDAVDKELLSLIWVHELSL